MLLWCYFSDIQWQFAGWILKFFLGDEYVQQMWSFICPELLSSIEREPEESVVPEMMESFAKVQ